MSKVVGWKITSKLPKAGSLCIVPAFEFDELEESVYAQLSAEFASFVESAKSPPSPDYDLLLGMTKELCSRYGLELVRSRLEKIASAASHSFGGFGCLDFLLGRDDLEEISFVGASKPLYAYSRKEARWLETNCFLCSDKFAVGLVNRMAQASGKRLSFATPRLEARLANGARLHAACPPVSGNEASFSLRLFPAQRIDLSRLVGMRTISAQAAALLWFAMQTDCSLLVTGNTGGGKTTLLNALADVVGSRERIVIVEDTPELSVTQQHVARLLASRTAMADLVKDTLRMRPDRVFVGEVRTSADCRALFDCLLSGQARGTYATFHADSAGEALDRLRLLGATEYDLGGLDLLAVVRRIPVFDSARKEFIEKRRVTEIAEVSGVGGKISARPVFRLDARSDSLAFLGLGQTSQMLGKIFSSFPRMGKKHFGKEWKRRAEFLSASHRDFAAEAERYLSD